MATILLPAALAALVVSGTIAHKSVPPALPPAILPAPIVADSAALSRALGTPDLVLTTRGETVRLLAGAAPVEGGCGTQIVAGEGATASGAVPARSRVLRWTDIAWTGTAPDGRTLVSFYQDEARLPGDTLAFAPADAAGFRAALDRVVTACRRAQRETARVLAAVPGPSQSCYFARLPQLELVAPSHPAEPQRAVLTMLSRETPEAELRLIVERPAPGSVPGGDEWGRPAVAFGYADRHLKDMGIARAGFAVDDAPVSARHAVLLFGDKRVRIAMDPVLRRAEPDTGGASFYSRLVAGEAVELTLLDTDGRSRAVLRFDAGPALAAARQMLAEANWSCDGAATAPPPAAEWKPMDATIRPVPIGAPVIALQSLPPALALASHPENAEGGPFGNGRLERGGQGKP